MRVENNQEDATGHSVYLDTRCNNDWHSPISLAWNEISFQIKKKAHNELESSGIRAYIFVLIRAFITIMRVFVNRACDKGNNGLFKLTVSSAEIIYNKKTNKKTPYRQVCGLSCALFFEKIN